MEVLLLLPFLAAAQSTAGGTTASEKLPNFVFMMADDLGYGDLGYTGGTADTPNLDSMASGPHSLKLNRFYSGAPVCSPTRGTVLTGRNHNRYCLWTANTGNNCDDFKCPSTMPLPTSEVTVAHLLKAKGYLTAVYGKWHVGNIKPVKGGNPKWPVVRPDMHGFDEWWVTERSAPTSDLNCACFKPEECPLGHYTRIPPCTDYYSRDNDLGVLLGLTRPIKGDDSLFLVTLVEEFLQSVTSRNKPFFLYIPFHTVHIRYIASEEYRARYEGHTPNEIDYYGAITGMDAAVGRIRDLLKQYNVSHNTMLWFTSDNGPENHTPGRTDGFRGRKRDLYEGGIRVPGIIEWPAMINSNRVSDYAVVSSDLLPTVCDIVDINVPSDRTIDGESILPLIRQQKPTRNKTIAWAYHIPNGNFNAVYNAAISGDRYKVHATYKSGSIRSAELYDLISDPFETTDISSKYPQVLRDYKDQLDTWKESVYGSAQEVGCLGVSKAPHCVC